MSDAEAKGSSERAADAVLSRRALLKGLAGAAGLAVVPGGLLAACGGSKSKAASGGATTSASSTAAASGSASSSGSTGKAVHLTCGYWDPNMNGPSQQIAAAFQKANPDISVEMQQTPPAEYWTKLQTAVSAGGGPDIISMNGPNYQLYASNGMLAPLDEYISKDHVDLSPFSQGLRDVYKYKNAYYAMPFNFSTIGLWYNKQLFDDAGVKYPDENWTWDDLKAAAQKLTNKSKGVYGIPATSDPAYMPQEEYYNTIYQAGGYIISPDGTKSGFDDPKTIEGLKFWTDLQAMGVSPSYQQMLDTNPSAMFISGKVAMFYGGPWRAPQWAKANLSHVDVTQLPKGTSQSRTCIHGTAFAINAHSKHKDEAWEVIKSFTSKDGEEAWGATGILIPAYQGTQDVWLKSLPQYNLKAYIDELQTALPYPVSKNTAVWQKDAESILSQAWAGKVDITTAAKQLAAKMNDDLAKEK